MQADIRAPIDWSSLAGSDPPPRRWAITAWLGFDHVTLMPGPGGIGKTLLAQQMGSALALGRSFIDTVPAPLTTLMWACEDDHDELWRRQVAIARWQGVPLDAFDRLHIVPRHGLDNALMTATRYTGKLVTLPTLKNLHEQAHDLSADVVILDNVAQLFGGNENNRHDVTFFMNALAGALPGRAVLLLAHPARAEGSEYSGSSAWENCARTRLLLGSKLPGQQQDDEPMADVRFLARRKANYSAKDWRRFTFKDGVLVPDEVEVHGGMVGHLRDKATDRVVVGGLAKLEALGIDSTLGASSGDFLPKQLLAYKFHEGRTKDELAASMRRLIVDGEIVKMEIGRYSNRSIRYGLRLASAPVGS